MRKQLFCPNSLISPRSPASISSFSVTGATDHKTFEWNVEDYHAQLHCKGVGAVGYLTVGLVDGLVVAIHQRILTRALMLDEIFEDNVTEALEEYDVMEEEFE